MKHTLFHRNSSCCLIVHPPLTVRPFFFFFSAYLSFCHSASLSFSHHFCLCLCVSQSLSLSVSFSFLISSLLSLLSIYISLSVQVGLIKVLVSCILYLEILTTPLSFHSLQILKQLQGSIPSSNFGRSFPKFIFNTIMVIWEREFTTSYAAFPLSPPQAEDHYLPEDIREEVLAFQEKCAYISGYSLQWSVDTCRSDYYYICEKDVGKIYKITLKSTKDE